LWGLLQPPATSSPLSPKILLSTLFSYTLCLCSSLFSDYENRVGADKGRLVLRILSIAANHFWGKQVFHLLYDFPWYMRSLFPFPYLQEGFWNSLK
jgi:hypothetical protein